MIKAVCFGEVLYDMFPDEERIGGAPLNVACRLSGLGVETTIISKVGADEKGEEIIAYLKSNNVGTANVKRDNKYPTGVVNVTLSRSGSATYEIAYPSAWDKVELTNEQIMSVENADVFIFGSLVCRDELSRKTLIELLKRAKLKVLDFNLRPPHYTKDLVLNLLEKADFIKFNDDELFVIAEMMGSGYHSLEQNLQFIAETTNTKIICVTKGRHGAVLLYNNQLFYNSGFKVRVKDTVGAGDSFLATLLAGLLQKEKPQLALDHACAVGALVAGEKGANPQIDKASVNNFMFPPST